MIFHIFCIVKHEAPSPLSPERAEIGGRAPNTSRGIKITLHKPRSSCTKGRYQTLVIGPAFLEFTRASDRSRGGDLQLPLQGLLCRAVKKIVFVCASFHTMSRNQEQARIGTTFWNVCEGPVKFNCSETDHLRSGEEERRLKQIMRNLCAVTLSQIASLAALHNSLFGATLALRVLSSIII